MAKKKKPLKRVWRIDTPKKQAKVSSALLVVDNAPLLKGHRARYQKVLKDVAKAESDLVKHQSKDGPEFEQWYHTTFGPQLTALRKGEDEIHQSARILIDVDELVMRDGCPDYIAYHRIKLREQGLADPYEAKYEKKKAASDADALDDDEFNPFGAKFDSSENDAFAEFLKQQANAYKKAHGTMPPGYEDIMRSLGQAQSTPPPPSNHKQIYRQIVTRLHPDRAEKFSPIEQALWHEAQNAYRSGDTAALEVILARCEAAQDGVEITRASLIVGMIAQARANLSQLRERLREFKRHPSWNFTGQKDRGLLKRKIHRQFQLDLEDQDWRLQSVRMDITMLEKRHAQWLVSEEKRKKKAANPPAKAEPKKSAPPAKASPPPKPQARTATESNNPKQGEFW
jgi:hypothetical protein